MKNKALLILIFSIFSGSLSFANEKDCSPIDLRSQMGEVRDQGDIGWCYANTAADLLSFEFRDQLQGREVSAIYMALIFNKTFIGKSNFEGGSAFLTLETYLHNQDYLCLRTDDQKVMSNGLKIPLKEKLEELRLFKAKYDAQVENPALWNDFFLEWEKIKKSRSYLFSMGDKKLLELLAHSHSEDFAKNIANTLCGQNFTPFVQKSSLKVIPALIPWIQTKALIPLNSQLGKHNIVGYAYRASVLTDPNSSQDWGSAHYSVLIGRKWNKNSNQCEYLIRNSWDKDCSSYAHSPIFKDRCDAGHIWMPENILTKSMIGLSYFKK
jgi:hypothetical protein